MESLTYMGHTFVEHGPGGLAPFSVVGTRLLRDSARCALAMRRTACLNGCGACRSVPSLPSQIRHQPKVKAYAFTVMALVAG